MNVEEALSGSAVGKQTAAGEPRRPSPLMGAAHVAAVWALAFAQPLFDLLGRSSAFFVARGNGAEEILAFALIVTVLPFLAVWALEAGLEAVAPAARWLLHLVLLGGLAACLFLQLIGQATQRPAAAMLIGSGVLAAGLVALYVRGRFMRSVLDILSPAPAVVLVMFLVVGPTSSLVFAAGDPEPLEVEPAEPAPVVTIVFDELPTGSLMDARGDIDGSRFPAFAELRSESTWYRNATSVAAFTSRAVPAIVTGKLPDGETLPIASEQPRSLFTLLGSYPMVALEDATQLCPEQLCPEAEAERSLDDGLGALLSDLSIVSRHLLLPEALRAGLPDVSETFGGFGEEIDGEPPTGEAAGGDGHVVAMAIARGDRQSEAARFRTFIRRIGDRPEAAPGLMYLHSQKPHYPWRNLPDGRLYSPDMGEWIRFMDDDSRWQAPESVTDIALQRHLLEVGHADSLLGGVMAALRREGIWDEAMVVVTADHGGAMTPGVPRRNPTEENLGQVGAVPLLVKHPGQQRPEVVDRHACTTEITGMIAAELGIELSWETDPCPPDRVRVADLPDGGAAAPLERVVEQRRSYVERIERLFGTGRGWGPVLSPRYGRELVGRPVGRAAPDGGEASAGASLGAPGPEGLGEAGADSSLGRAGPAGRRGADVGPPVPVIEPREGESAMPDDPEQALSHRPGARLVPALLQHGELTGVGAGETLAIAFNGRIAAVGRSFELEGRPIYSILVPPAMLAPGENDVEVLEVHGLDRHGRPTAGLALQPLWPDP